MVKVTKETKSGEEGLQLWSRSKTEEDSGVNVTDFTGEVNFSSLSYGK